MKEKPKRESVYIARLEKELRLNFITLADDEWIADRFSDEEIHAAFTKPDHENAIVILTLFWRCLDDDSKRLVRDVKLVKFDDNGNEEVIDESHQPTRMKYLISGEDELLAIMSAWVKTRRKSSPEILENAKKKMKVEQSSQKSKSSSSLPVSMDTPSSSARSSHEENSLTS